jgi:hypothetical protein
MGIPLLNGQVQIKTGEFPFLLHFKNHKIPICPTINGVDLDQPQQRPNTVASAKSE